jgi:rhodanese-related sulfurtransferase
VTDNLTGLMWTKDANLPGSATTWQEALDYVAGMNAGTNPNSGYTDWRLPNRKELYSLTDVSQAEPALPSGHPFTGVENEYYWSSTTYAYGCANAWKVLMGYGLVHAYPKSDSSFVWPVRAGLHDHTDITPEQAHNLIDTDAELLVVDVRTPDEFCDNQHIPGAINLSWSDVFQQKSQELSVDAQILVVCESGYRSNQAATFLDHNGYLHVYDMSGGMSEWQWETEPCYSMFGTVTGDLIDGVTMTLSGDISWNTVTDSAGNYSFKKLSSGTYTVTPSLSGYYSNPPSRQIIISGTDITDVNFEIVSCAYSIFPTNRAFNAEGGEKRILTITSSNSCTWTATSNNDWIIITSGGSGIGNGVVYYSVATNTTKKRRTGTITIAGMTFTVNQRRR